eukprot:13689666-Alexandrium_andersonii.AAC.1
MSAQRVACQEVLGLHLVVQESTFRVTGSPGHRRGVRRRARGAQPARFSQGIAQLARLRRAMARPGGLEANAR